MWLTLTKSRAGDDGGRIRRHLDGAARVSDPRQRAKNKVVARPSHWRCQPNCCLKEKSVVAHSPWHTF
jgi:hypothetical protein